LLFAIFPFASTVVSTAPQTLVTPEIAPIIGVLLTLRYVGELNPHSVWALTEISLLIEELLIETLIVDVPAPETILIPAGTCQT